MKKILIAAFVLIISQNLVMAQNDYTTSIGVRGGLFSGFSVKHFMDRSDAVEGVVALHYRGLLAAGMYQRHANAFDAPGLNWYYGGGVFLGAYSSNPWVDDKGALTTIGALGVLGIEYKIDEIPITIGVDITPAFNFFGYVHLWPGAGLTLRYILN